MLSTAYDTITSAEQLHTLDEQRDIEICGRSLASTRASRFAAEGAHDPTPTPYFVLEDLFASFSFDRTSHVLDVGCGTGRALAYFASREFPGRATGIELDPYLAEACKTWTDALPNITVKQGDVLVE